MMATIDLATALRRSLLRRWHRNNGAVFGEHAGSIVVEHYNHANDEAKASAILGICDLSLLPRDGITGPGSGAWIRSSGYAQPQRANSASRQSDESLLVRLSTQEYLRLDLRCLYGNLSGETTPAWDRGSDRAYPLPRADSHCLFTVSGHCAPAMFAKICGVDLRPPVFADGNVAQTSLARVNAIIIRHDLAICCNYFVLTATSATEYLWDCLLDASDEFDGRVVGISALQSLVNS